jgi:hypothetical protein
MTEMSTPACRKFIAQLWRNTCGDTPLAAMDGQLSAAVVAYLATSHWTASTLSGRPVTVGNSGWFGSPARSAVQARSTVTVCRVNYPSHPAEIR